MIFHSYSPVHFESWDWRNSVETGIGGSETCAIETAWRLARRGHEVHVYAPIPDDCPTPWRGVQFHRLESADFTAAGVWLLFRCPSVLADWPKVDGQQKWLVMQDESYQWPAGAAVDRILAFCGTHARETAKRQPALASKIVTTSNGLKMELVRETFKALDVLFADAHGCANATGNDDYRKIAATYQRDVKKLVYASSPDRGLLNLLKIFRRAYEFDPELSLDCYYGFDNIEKLLAKDGRQFGWLGSAKREIEKLLHQPGVTWKGRVGQPELYAAWATAGLWCYPTNFTETSCITCMEAQALGAIPITNPIWALGENVMHGEFIEGDATDPLNQARYAAAIVKWASPEMAEVREPLRVQMAKDARLRFNWERNVDQWEAWALRGTWEPSVVSQYAFQHAHVSGRTLNVGCDIDFSNLKARGALNVDLNETSPILGAHTKADLIADARDLPAVFDGRFETVVLGDLLEHMTDEDVLRALLSAKRAATKQIVITCPEDHRPIDEQHAHAPTMREYADGISSCHPRPVTRAILEDAIARAGLTVRSWQTIDYTHFLGHGVVCGV